MGQYIGGSVCPARQRQVRPLQETPTITHESYTVGGGNTPKHSERPLK